MKIKIFSIICILITILFTLTGCYDATGIEELAYATAIGLDVSDNKTLSLTFQFSIPSSSSESGSGQSNETDTITVSCTSINSGISLVNSYISKQINLSHCKVIIISEELAAQGISEYIDTLSNNVEIRPDCNIIISKCDAKDFIENAQPIIETLTARYYEIALKSSEYTGYTTSTKFTDFANAIKSPEIQPTAILGGLSSKEAKQSAYFSNGQDSSSKAGDSPIEDADTVETFGTAVFYEDKLVGELNGIETICHLITTNKLESCTISMPNPLTTKSNLDLYIKQQKPTKIKIDFINGTPYISINVFLEAYGLSLDNNTNYSNSQDVTLLNNYAKKYIKTELENYLYKTSKEFNSDISGLGKYAIIKYSTINEWLSSNWLENFKNSFFNVNVNVNILSGSKFTKAP